MLLLTASPAWSHTKFLDSTPADKAIMASGPAEVTLRFSEPVGDTALGSFKVLAVDGSRVDTGRLRARSGGRLVVVPLQDTLTHGTYTLLWRVVSSDSHSVAGTSTFWVLPSEPSATAPPAKHARPAEPVPDVVLPVDAGRAAGNLLAVARLMLFAGLVLLVGGVGFLLILWPAGQTFRAARRMVWAGWALAVLGSVGGLLMQGPHAAGRSLASSFDPALLSAVLQTRYGVAAVVRLSLLAGAALVLLGSGRIRRSVLASGAAVVGLGLLLSTSAVGHAGTGHLAGLALSADALHLAAGCAWLGGLAQLIILLRQPPAELLPVLPRWSRYAAAAIGVLIVTGTFASWREVGTLNALDATTYGRLLLVKIGLVALMLAFGAFGRSWVLRHYVLAVVHAASPTATVDRPAPGRPAVARLRRSVLLEAVTAAAVLTVTAVLVQTPPARAARVQAPTQVAPAFGT